MCTGEAGYRVPAHRRHNKKISLLAHARAGGAKEADLYIFRQSTSNWNKELLQIILLFFPDRIATLRCVNFKFVVVRAYFLALGPSRNLIVDFKLVSDADAFKFCSKVEHVVWITVFLFRVQPKLSYLYLSWALLRLWLSAPAFVNTKLVVPCLKCKRTEIANRSDFSLGHYMQLCETTAKQRWNDLTLYILFRFVDPAYKKRYFWFLQILPLLDRLWKYTIPQAD